MRSLLVVVLWSSFALGCGTECEPHYYVGPVQVSDRAEKEARAYEAEVRQGRLRERTNTALNAIVRFAAYKLKKKGEKKKAEQIIKEWESRWDGFLLRRDLGDHAPLSTWLAEKTAMLEMILGTEIMKATRLYDLKVINYAIPVVFRCIDKVDEAEFKRHFVPLCGVTMYWVSFFACVGGTWGTGFLWCSPIAMGAEFLTGHFIAPSLNGPMWRFACKPEERGAGLTIPEYIPFTNREASDADVSY